MFYEQGCVVVLESGPLNENFSEEGMSNVSRVAKPSFLEGRKSAYGTYSCPWM